MNSVYRSTIDDDTSIFDQVVPDKHRHWVEYVKKLWYSDKALNAIKIYGLKQKHIIIDVILDEAEKSASQECNVIKQLYKEIVKEVGIEYLNWIDFCNRSVYFSSEDYSPEHCHWTRYLTIDRLKSVCPNKNCSKPTEICEGCMKKYVTNFLQHIPVTTRNHFNDVFTSRNINYALALWITYHQTHNDAPEYAGYHLRDLTDENDAYRLYLIEGNSDRNLLLMGAMTGSLVTIDHYMDKMKDSLIWMVVAKRFLEVWPYSKQRSHAVGYTLAMNKLTLCDQFFMANIDITRNLLDWDKHRVKTLLHGFTIVNIEKLIASFMLELDRLCSVEEIDRNAVFDLFNETDPRIRYKVVRRLGPVIWNLVNRSPPQMDIIQLILDSYSPKATNVLLLLFSDISFINSLASVNQLPILKDLLVNIHESPFNNRSLYFQARATIYLLCNRYVKTDPTEKIVTTMLKYLYCEQDSRETNMEEMINSNRVFHESMSDAPYKHVY